MTSRELIKLERAVLANTHRPDEAEMEEIKVHKKIMTSLKLEGDSKMGMILFVGIAKSLGASRDEIIDHIGLEFIEEYNHKFSEFNRYLAHKNHHTRIRFENKIKLINNYLTLIQ